MKRLILVALALAALAPVTGRAAPPIPRPGACVMVPMKPGGCSYTALVNGTVAFALQGAVEFRVTHAGVTTLTCVFGSGGGTGPSIRKGDAVAIIKRTETTTFVAGLAAGNAKPWRGYSKQFAC
jgi:hypothetical protein